MASIAAKAGDVFQLEVTADGTIKVRTPNVPDAPYVGDDISIPKAAVLFATVQPDVMMNQSIVSRCSRTYVDKFHRLHIGKNLEKNDQVFVYGFLAYINPSDSTTGYNNIGLNDTFIVDLTPPS